MGDEVKVRSELKHAIESINNADGIYNLFHKLNYPKDKIFNSSYTKKIKEFDFAKEEAEKVVKIYTVMSYDKLNVFLVESKTLSKQFIRYVTRVFSDMYPRFLLICSINYKEIHIIFPDYEKKEAGKHKLKTTTLVLKTDEIYRTDLEVLKNIHLNDSNSDWRSIWRLWKDAFNVQKVTQSFFDDYKKIFFVIKKHLKPQKIGTKIGHEFTLQLLNRIMFIYFITKKEWLNKDMKFMKTYWETYKKVDKFGDNAFYSKWLQPLFFEAFNNKYQYHAEMPEEVNRLFANSPYLNGGLFSKKKGLDDLNIVISDSLFKEIFEFFESYNFTIKEDSVLDIEVSVDPQMIGYVYESLANISEDLYEKEDDVRGDWGIFYTAKIEVDFMCRRSIVEFITKHVDIPKNEIYEFVFDEDKERIEKKFNQRRCWEKIEDALDSLSIVDPACGSGAFLVGMLNVLVELYKVVYTHNSRNLTDFEMKYRIIQRSLYGVDVMPWAIHASELRLWLQLIVETVFKEDELRKHPLLPNLNMNLRVGDSLVQEIGGITFNVRSNNLKPHLKKKLDELKNEKSKYFESSPSAKYKTLEEFKSQEIRLFEEIIDERIESLNTDIQSLSHSSQKTEKQSGLLGATVNIEAKNLKKTRQKIDEIEHKIKSCQDEITQLEKVKTLLRNPLTKPFVWDMDFAEVFSDKGGFDIVLGNPPYVRQEKITPPNKLKGEITLEDRKTYKELLINSVKNRFKVIKDLDRKSDLYLYFYFHGLSLLNQDGVFCFITSNSWLDVGYGANLQEFLLRYVHIIGIYDNQAKRSFEHADVNTIIALLGAPVVKKQQSLLEFGVNYNGTGKVSYHGFNQIAKFIMFKKPFEESINTKNMITIENAKEITKTEEFRVYPINQEDLLEDGWEYPENYDGDRFSEGRYDGNKWGGKYLRAPDIFFTILEKGKGKLVALGKIAKIRRGFTTGANDFFYLDEKSQKKWAIEKEYLKQVIKSPKECEFVSIDPKVLQYKVFLCNKSKSEIKNTNALKYIEWGESQVIEIKSGGDKGKKLKGYNSLETVKNRNHWYGLGDFEPSNFAQGQIFNDRFIFTNTEGLLCDCVLNELTLEKKYSDKIKESELSLNSTITPILIQLFGRSSLGEGALKLQVGELRKILIVDPEKISKIKSINPKRKILSIFEECGIDPSKPIREQEPKPLQDRAELDEIVFDELKLTKDERKEIYWAVCELVQNRISKANSLKD